MTYRSRSVNLLEGPILPKLISFALPLILTNLLQVFYSAADMMVVGLSGVSGAIGAIGTTNAMTSLIVNLFTGFSVGANISVSHAIGAGDTARARNAVHTSLLFGLLLGVIGGGIGFCITRPVLSAMGDEGRILDLASLYARIYFLGLPFLALTNYAAAIFRAKGDTKTPLFVLSGAGILNILLNLVLVLVFHMSVDGVAVATAVSNGASAAVLLFLLSRDSSQCRFSPRELCINPSALGEIVRIGLPAGIQSSLFSISNMLIQSSVISMNNLLCPGGSVVIDGNAAAVSLISFVNTGIGAVHHAATTFVSQHCGAGLHRRNTRVIRACYLLATLISVVAGGLIVLLADPLSRLYVQEDAAVAISTLRLRIILLPYFTMGFVEVGSAVLRSYGRNTLSMFISLLGVCVFRVFWVMVVFRAYETLECIYLSYPISWVLTGGASYFAALPLRLKRIREETAAEETHTMEPNHIQKG